MTVNHCLYADHSTNQEVTRPCETREQALRLLQRTARTFCFCIAPLLEPGYPAVTQVARDLFLVLGPTNLALATLKTVPESLKAREGALAVPQEENALVVANLQCASELIFILANLTQTTIGIASNCDIDPKNISHLFTFMGSLFVLNSLLLLTASALKHKGQLASDQIVPSAYLLGSILCIISSITTSERALSILPLLYAPCFSIAELAFLQNDCSHSATELTTSTLLPPDLEQNSDPALTNPSPTPPCSEPDGGPEAGFL